MLILTRALRDLACSELFKSTKIVNLLLLRNIHSAFGLSSYLILAYMYVNCKP